MLSIIKTPRAWFESRQLPDCRIRSSKHASVGLICIRLTFWNDCRGRLSINTYTDISMNGGGCLESTQIGMGCIQHIDATLRPVEVWRYIRPQHRWTVSLDWNPTHEQERRTLKCASSATLNKTTNDQMLTYAEFKMEEFGTRPKWQIMTDFAVISRNGSHRVDFG